MYSLVANAEAVDQEPALHPLRSALTVLGIFIGVASVIWLLAIGEGISRAAEEQIAGLGARNIIVRTIKPSADEVQDAGYGLTRDDYIACSPPCRRSTRRCRFAKSRESSATARGGSKAAASAARPTMPK